MKIISSFLILFSILSASANSKVCYQAQNFEVIHAQQKNWAIPVYTNKKESDLNYERLSNVLLKSFPDIRVAFGSHNVRSIASAIATAQSLNLNPKSFEKYIINLFTIGGGLNIAQTKRKKNALNQIGSAIITIRQQNAHSSQACAHFVTSFFGMDRNSMIGHDA